MQKNDETRARETAAAHGPTGAGRSTHRFTHPGVQERRDVGLASAAARTIIGISFDSRPARGKAAPTGKNGEDLTTTAT